MWKRAIAGGLSAALALSLAACAPGEESEAEPVDEERAAISAQYGHVLGLTPEERLADYDYFAGTLMDSYPCWGVLDREGVDYRSILDDYREMVSESDDDSEFYSAIYSALFLLGMNGHLSMIEPAELADYQSAYAGVEDRTHWYEVLTNPVTAEQYPKLGEMLAAWEGEEGADSDPDEAPENVTTLIIEEGKIAYLKIDSFAGDPDEDGAKIAPFLEQVQDYDHLIIDITQNSGGSDDYWMNLLVSPLARETLTSTNYALVRNSANNAPYLAEAFGGDALHPIGELPDLPRLADEDRALATHFLENTLAVEPSGAGFGGQIWLLVSENVYSSAEAFTVFCKDTGFAVLVGAPTGGDGIGIDPVYFALPHSGILVRFSALFGLNPDGSSNEETGTAPDFRSPAGESPLITALRAIRGA